MKKIFVVILLIPIFALAQSSASSAAAVIAAAPSAPLGASGILSFLGDLFGFIKNATVLSFIALLLSYFPNSKIAAILKKAIDFISANLEHPNPIKA